MLSGLTGLFGFCWAYVRHFQEAQNDRFERSFNMLQDYGLQVDDHGSRLDDIKHYLSALQQKKSGLFGRLKGSRQQLLRECQEIKDNIAHAIAECEEEQKKLDETASEVVKAQAAVGAQVPLGHEELLHGLKNVPAAAAVKDAFAAAARAVAAAAGSEAAVGDARDGAVEEVLHVVEDVGHTHAKLVDNLQLLATVEDDHINAMALLDLWYELKSEGDAEAREVDRHRKKFKHFFELSRKLWDHHPGTHNRQELTDYLLDQWSQHHVREFLELVLPMDKAAIRSHNRTCNVTDKVDVDQKNKLQIYEFIENIWKVQEASTSALDLLAAKIDIETEPECKTAGNQ
ncbi:unnamed protein product [Polarella glacialis]|uniref:Uncharacterized protein n=1 Tax=Polarella glacialis TaxID=89957 RepID=A0A813FQ96_POLGL|nr:unnamed protein product [Polarella glacialis]